MTARVPYLTALTKRSAASPALRPPRHLFADQALPGQADFAPALTAMAERPVASGMPVATRADPAPVPVASPPTPTPGEASAGRARAVTSSPLTRHQPPPITSVRPSRQQPRREPANPLLPTIAPPPPQPTQAPAADEPSHLMVSSAVAPARPPESWADPRWALPAELPVTPTRKDSGGAVPLPEPAQSAGQPSTDQRQPVPDLMPAPASASGTAVPDAGHGQDRPLGSRPAQVSIGTIEVTVVPAAPPQPPRRDRPRPVSPLPASPPADRLRDGIRRWHGTAQG